MITTGVDIGSLASKAVVLDTVTMTVIGSAVIPSGPRPAATAERVLRLALSDADADADTVAATVATGYGRESLPFADATVTEITCAARGAHLIDGATRTVVDIGGQDSKAIRVDERGFPLDFALNDRCAAGTGRFLEVMAGALETDVTDLERLALEAEAPAAITRTCTVFAESEIIGLLADGALPSAVAAGLCRAVALRTAALVRQIGVRPPVMLVGGVGMNRAIASELERAVDSPLITPEQPQLVVATGAAVVAADRISERSDRGSVREGS